MQFSSLLAALPKELAPPASMHRDLGSDPVIRGISYDSRKVAPGDLFVALVGSASDGHDYLERAITLGAVALLVQTNSEKYAESRRCNRPSARHAPITRSDRNPLLR
jgi:UDP-N-acetylmuramyl pentapeptide synthase